jgi:hypothetical protein
MAKTSTGVGLVAAEAGSLTDQGRLPFAAAKREVGTVVHESGPEMS